MISHLNHCLCAYKKTLLEVGNQCEIPILGKTLIVQLLLHRRVCLFMVFGSLHSSS